MKIFAFISRHEPTQKQYLLCEQQDIKLVPIGDFDAFAMSWDWVMDKWYEHYAELDSEEEQIYIDEDLCQFDGVIVVHPATALNLIADCSVGVFENTQRPNVDGPPTFDTEKLWIYE